MNTPLNAQLIQCPGGAHRNFVLGGRYAKPGQRLRRVLLAEGTRLAKFTDANLFHGGRVSPWWVFDRRVSGLDAGLDSVLQLARASGRPLTDCIRDMYAVMFEWNSLALLNTPFLRIQRIKLTCDAYAFHGPAAPVDGNRPPLASASSVPRPFSGGALQLYIPNLT
ncbi:MAG: hypothetical protein NTV21_05640, partial [Planctomycetota bacterium]|nr:hypothetical protein [Planctomycetota bacterium]